MHNILGICVRIAVVSPAFRLRLHIQRRCALVHLQGAENLTDRVVALLGGAAPNERIGVFAGADIRLAARCREGGGLLLSASRGHEAADTAAGRQWLTVVFAFRALRGDGQRSGRDFQRAVDGVHGELVRHNVVVFVLHHGCAADFVRQIAHVGAARVARRQSAHRVVAEIHICTLHQVARRTFHSTVIDVARVAIRRHIDDKLVHTVRDGQRTRCLCSKVVVAGDIGVAGLHLEVVAETARVGAH